VPINAKRLRASLPEVVERVRKGTRPAQRLNLAAPFSEWMVAPRFRDGARTRHGSRRCAYARIVLTRRVSSPTWSE